MGQVFRARDTRLDRPVATCLAKHPDDRWQTARDLVRELRWLADPASRAAGAADGRIKKVPIESGPPDRAGAYQHVGVGTGEQLLEAILPVADGLAIHLHDLAEPQPAQVARVNPGITLHLSWAGGPKGLV